MGNEQSILKELFNENSYRLDREYIVALNKSSNYGDLNNVVVGVQKHCYAVNKQDEVSIFNNHFNIKYIVNGPE